MEIKSTTTGYPERNATELQVFGSGNFVVSGFVTSGLEENDGK